MIRSAPTMLVVGLTGGIGSGKSTVAALLAAKGAVVVDADRLAREAVAPGTPGLAAVAARFGPGVVAADGSLDRSALAAMVFRDPVFSDPVFSDPVFRDPVPGGPASGGPASGGPASGGPAALADLNAIVHPAVRAAIAQRLAELRSEGHDGVVVLEIPLLVESGRSYGAAAVVVVDCPEEVALRRLVEGRHMDEADARRRMAAQVSRAERLAAADVVIDNSGPVEALAGEVDRVWAALTAPER